MNNYNDVKASIKEKIEASSKNGKHPISASSTDLIALTQSLLNSPDYVVKEYHPTATDDSGYPIVVEKSPGKRFRDSLKPMLRSMGVDKDDMKQYDSYHFSKETAGALSELSGTAVKDLLTLGRKYKFPINALDESQHSVYISTVDEKVTKPNKFETVNGKTITVPTGDTVVTQKHTVLKASNRVMHWQKKKI